MCKKPMHTFSFFKACVRKMNFLYQNVHYFCSYFFCWWSCVFSTNEMGKYWGSLGEWCLWYSVETDATNQLVNESDFMVTRAQWEEPAAWRVSLLNYLISKNARLRQSSELNQPCRMTLDPQKWILPLWSSLLGAQTTTLHVFALICRLS
jgi:hypothetical protein